MTERARYELPDRRASARPLYTVTRDLVVANGTTSTIVQDEIIGARTQVLLTALSAAAAAITASVYVSARDRGQVTLTHADPGADAEFSLLLIG